MTDILCFGLHCFLQVWHNGSAIAMVIALDHFRAAACPLWIRSRHLTTLLSYVNMMFDTLYPSGILCQTENTSLAKTAKKVAHRKPAGKFDEGGGRNADLAM